MKKSRERVSKWRAATAKQFALTGIAVVGFLAVAAAAILKFTKYLMPSDDVAKKLA